MESKRLNRKFSSLFWWILYSLPLIIFFISLIGTFTIYKETGQDLEFTTEVTDHVISGTGFIADQYVENLYFNTSLSIDEVYSFCDTLNLDESSK